MFSYVDFDTQRLIITDEFLLDGVTNTTADIAKVIREKEKDWGYGAKITRCADNNLQIINDMSLMYGINMYATKKDNLH